MDARILLIGSMCGFYMSVSMIFERECDCCPFCMHDGSDTSLPFQIDTSHVRVGLIAISRSYNLYQMSGDSQFVEIASPDMVSHHCPNVEYGISQDGTTASADIVQFDTMSKKQ